MQSSSRLMLLIGSHGFSFHYKRWFFIIQVSPNVSTTPITAMGCRQCLSLSVVQLKGKHCRHPIAVMGVVNTFGLNHFVRVVPFPKYIDENKWSLRDHSNITLGGCWTFSDPPTQSNDYVIFEWSLILWILFYMSNYVCRRKIGMCNKNAELWELFVFVFCFFSMIYGGAFWSKPVLTYGYAYCQLSLSYRWLNLRKFSTLAQISKTRC